MLVKIVNKSNNPLPEYATEHSAGIDLRAFLSEPVVLQPFERKLISTGIFIELPVGYEAQVRPRSGLAVKHGITVLNSPGTIDSDYRGELMVILINLSNTAFIINNSERIAQLVVSKHEQLKWQETDSLEKSERGDGGFGHTGKK